MVTGGGWCYSWLAGPTALVVTRAILSLDTRFPCFDFYFFIFFSIFFIFFSFCIFYLFHLLSFYLPALVVTSVILRLERRFPCFDFYLFYLLNHLQLQDGLDTRS